jgi:hypothetical protein
MNQLFDQCEEALLLIGIQCVESARVTDSIQLTTQMLPVAITTLDPGTKLTINFWLGDFSGLVFEMIL